MNKTFKVDHTDVFADDIDGANRQSPDPRDLDTALFQIDRRGTKRRLLERHM